MQAHSVLFVLVSKRWSPQVVHCQLRLLIAPTRRATEVQTVAKSFVSLCYSTKVGAYSGSPTNIDMVVKLMTMASLPLRTTLFLHGRESSDKNPVMLQKRLHTY